MIVQRHTSVETASTLCGFLFFNQRCWFGNFFDWTGRRHEFVVNETMTYLRYYKCLSLFLLISDPTFGRIFDGQEICNGHTFEHIYDYDIKLETTKILMHVFDKVGYWKLG